MDVFEYYMKEARRFLDEAEHIRTVSYPLADDPKVFLSMLAKLHKSHKSILSLLLHANRSSKASAHNLVKQDFDSALKQAKSINEEQTIISKPLFSTITTTHSLLNEHKQSPVEFPRQQEFVMCTPAYATTSISLEQVTSLSLQTKELLHEVFKQRDFFITPTNKDHDFDS